MTQKEAILVRKGLLKAGYKVSLLYTGPSSVVVRLLKKSNKTWTIPFRGSSEKAIMQKLATVYPLNLSKKDAQRLKKLKIKAEERKHRKAEEASQLEEDVAKLKEETRKNTSKPELRALCAVS